MCGRYTLKTASEIVAKHFQLPAPLPTQACYNIAPSQLVSCVRTIPECTMREGTLMHWGLRPSWSKASSTGAMLINVRAETVSQKPAFRSAFRQRRCFIIADGFYEWQRRGSSKQPYYIRLHTEQPFAFAGLWEHWTEPDGAIRETCAILTTEPNTLIAPLHHRMPVIIPPHHYNLWLDPHVQELNQVQTLCCALTLPKRWWPSPSADKSMIHATMIPPALSQWSYLRIHSQI